MWGVGNGAQAVMQDEASALLPGLLLTSCRVAQFLTRHKTNTNQWPLVVGDLCCREKALANQKAALAQSSGGSLMG